jgi:nicotinamidase/pyrazinamidase
MQSEIDDENIISIKTKEDIMNASMLLIVDMQNDFCPGGALPVPEGDKIIPVINNLSHKFPLVVATKDWHPENHVSFSATHPGKKPFDTIFVNGLKQELWPSHCIAGTKGADFHPDLDILPFTMILHKGTKDYMDSYSAFFENDQKTHTGLAYYLDGLGFSSVFIAGLAADVCVLASAIDSQNLGFKTYVIKDATRGVDTPAGSLEKAFSSMMEAGILLINSKEVPGYV